MFVLHSQAFKTAALVCALIAAGFAPAAFAAVDIYSNVAPPHERRDIVPTPPDGYTWAPGYRAWRGHHHFWVQGHWVRARTGYHWYGDRWDRAGDRWIFYRGHWERD